MNAIIEKIDLVLLLPGNAKPLRLDKIPLSLILSIFPPEHLVFFFYQTNHLMSPTT